MVEIHKNLRNTVSDVNSLSEAMKGLQTVANSLFGMLGGLSESLGGKVSTAQSKIEYMTPQGVTAQSHYAQFLANKAEQDFQANKEHVFLSFGKKSSEQITLKPGHGVDFGGGHFAYTIPTNDEKRSEFFKKTANQIISGLAPETIADRVRNELNTEVNEVSSEPTPSLRQTPDLSGIGYGLSDLQKVRASAANLTSEQGSARFEMAMKGFSAKNDNVSAVLSSTLKSLQLAIAQNTTELDEATSTYKEVSQSSTATTDQRDAALRNLTNAIGRLDQNQKAASELLKQGGGGEGPPTDDPVARRAYFRRAMEFGAAGLGVLGAGVHLGLGAYTSLGQATIGKDLESAQIKGDLSQRYFQQISDANDMTSPENILKYRANLLMPGRNYDHLGTIGYQRALDKGMQDATENLDLQEKRRISNMLSSAGAVAGQLGQAAIGVAGRGTVGPLAGTIALHGAASAVSSAGAGINQYINDPYTALTGGLQSGPAAMLGRAMYGDDEWNRRAAAANRAAQGNLLLQAQSRAQDFMNAEVQQNPATLLALREYQSMMSAQIQATQMVGGRYAPSAMSEMISFGQYGNKSFADIQRANADRASRESILSRARAAQDPLSAQLDVVETRLGKLNDLETKDVNFRDFRKFSKMAQDPKTKWQGLKGLDEIEVSQQQMDTYSKIDMQIRQNQLKRDQLSDSLDKKYNQPIEASSLRTSYSRFGLSEAEGMLRKAQITSALGFDQMASSADFSQMSRLALSGYGGMDQQLQNLGRLNSVTGGQNNIKNLTNIFSDAVAAGFDKSRASRFVSMTADLMESVKATTSFTSSLLSDLSRAGGGGKGNELDLQAAAKGISGLAGYSGQTSGLSGMVKSAAAAAAGFDLSTGFASVVDTNVIQRADMIKQIETGQNITPQTRRLLALNNNDKNKVLGQLQQVQQTEVSSLLTTLEGAGLPINMTEWTEKLKQEKDPKKRRQMIEQAALQAGGVSSGLGMGADAGSAAMLTYVSSIKDDKGKALIESGDKARLERDLNLGEQKGVDPAVINRRNFLNQVLADFSSNIEKVEPTSKVYKDFLEAGGNAFSISAEAAKRAGNQKLSGQKITLDAIQQAQRSGDTSFMDAAKDSMKDLNTLQLARNMSLNTDLIESKIQSVRVENFQDMKIWLAGPEQLRPDAVRNK